MTYREPEGLTLLRDEADTAKSGLPHAFCCRGLSLNVHSSLYAAGFLAAMSINIVSAFHRDSISVPAARADEALEVLRALASESAGPTPAPFRPR